MPYQQYRHNKGGTNNGTNYKKNGQNVSTVPTHSALQPAMPVPPVGGKAFPPPINITTQEDTTQDITDNSDSMMMQAETRATEGEDCSKTDLNKTKDGKIKKKQKWTKTEKKSYINVRLRRMISPKPPVQILEELVQQENADLSYNFLEPVNEGGMQLFTCEVTIRGEVYTGTGPSKPIARNIAAEGAIHAFISNSVQSAHPSPETEDVADNAPWSALASLGLFKLFNDWQSQGYTVPHQFMATPTPIAKTSTATTAIQNTPDQTNNSFIQQPAKMPADPTSKHPVMLLNELYPGVTYEGSLGVVPGNMFGMTVEIQARSFHGTGRSKKDAKKACAIAALKSLHNIEYNNLD